MLNRAGLALALAVGLIVIGCSGGATDPPASPTVPAATGTAASPASAAPSPSPPAPPRFTETTDVVYMTVDGAALLMDVYTPIGAGPWPVVVAFHGLDSNGKDELDTALVAEAAAEEMVVFAASWIVWDPGLFPFQLETFEQWKGTASCAVAYAQQHATEYGGDPARSVAYGFSAGAGAALLATLQPSGGAIPGCATDAAPTPVIGAVLGDGEYFLHSTNFDEAFAADLEGMQAEVAGLTDPTAWPQELGAEFFFWVAERGPAGRSIGDAADETGWLAQRDPDGSIRADLGELDQLADASISNLDAAELLERRLTGAGVEVTLDVYPGGHTTFDKVPEIIGYLKAAAGR